METVAVDRAGWDHVDGDPRGRDEDRAEEVLAPFRCHLLRVVQEPERPHAMVTEPVVVEEDAGSHERSGERAPAGLVSPGDESRAESTVEREELLARARHEREDND